MNTLHDIRYAFRMLLKRPGFTVILILTLALGIGANTTIFSAIDAVLLNPLPYKNPERLMVVWETNKQLGPEMWIETKPRLGTFSTGDRGIRSSINSERFSTINCSSA